MNVSKESLADSFKSSGEEAAGTPTSTVEEGCLPAEFWTPSSRQALLSIRKKPSQMELRGIVAICIAMLVLPFILWGVWILVSRMSRAWRVRSATPGLHCIGTWSGGVDAENHAETLRTRQIRKANPRSDRFSTDSTAGYSRIFWDPSREKRGTHARGQRKSIMRLLPSWTRDSHGGSAINPTISPNSLSLAEEGNLVIRLLY